MRNHPKETGNAWRRFFLATTAVVVLAVSVLADAPTSPRLWAQSSAAPAAKPQSLEAMEAAGVKMSFDAASVKPNKSGSLRANNIGGLYRGAAYSPTGGLFSATRTPLEAYIMFAYDLTSDQVLRLESQSPNWIRDDNFDIQARAEGNPTRQQMQLMMQSLLADRFKLVVHTETKETPVYALALAKPGKTGPQLQPDNKPCPSEPTPPPSGAPPPAPPMGPTAEFPTACGFSAVVANGRWRSGGRHVTIESLALNMTGPATGVDRPVVDRTGLTGTYDFSIEFVPERNQPRPDFQYDPEGPTYIEALKEQLGLKLEPQTGPVEVLVLDHAEEPSPN